MNGGFGRSLRDKQTRREREGSTRGSCQVGGRVFAKGIFELSESFVRSFLVVAMVVSETRSLPCVRVSSHVLISLSCSG